MEAKPILVAYYNGYSTRNYRQSRRNSKRYGSYSRYRNSHRYGKYSHSYRRTNYPLGNYSENIKEVKKRTTWEAPTPLDKQIEEEIEKAQVNDGPTSKAVGNIMIKYAKRYYDTKDYTKSKKMADRILKLNDVSPFDGISMDEVKKVRQKAIAKINETTSNPLKKPSYSKYSALNTRPSHSRYSPMSHSLFNSSHHSSYSTSSPSRIWSHNPSFYKRRSSWQSSSTATGRVNKRGKGVTEFDYSPRKTSSRNSRGSSSGGAKTNYTPGGNTAFKYPTYQRKRRTVGRFPIFNDNNQGKIELLDSRFKKYKSH